jgi:ribosomal protein L5
VFFYVEKKSTGMFTSRLRFHYEHILRQDLLLKGQYANIMEVPRLAKAHIAQAATPKGLLAQPPHGKQTSAVSTTANGDVQNACLALEILCGQKGIATVENPETSGGRHVKASQLQKSMSAGAKNSGIKLKLNTTVRSCLRAHILYNFLEKLITIIACYEFKSQINTKAIHLNIGTNLLRLFPEIQNHFEIFESAQSVNVIIVTSAKSAQETRLLWTGLLQKEV